MSNDPRDVLVDGYVTLDGAAQALGATYWRVYRFIRTHQVQTRRLGKSLLVRLEDLNGLGQRTEN